MTRQDLGLVFDFVEEKTAGHCNAIVTALATSANFLLTVLIDDDSYGVSKDIFARDPKHGFSVTCASFSERSMARFPGEP